MRIQIPIVVEMTDQQVKAYADEYGVGELHDDGTWTFRTKDIVDDVRSLVLTLVQESEAFGEIGDGQGTRGADVSIKR